MAKSPLILVLTKYVPSPMASRYFWINGFEFIAGGKILLRLDDRSTRFGLIEGCVHYGGTCFQKCSVYTAGDLMMHWNRVEKFDTRELGIMIERVIPSPQDAKRKLNIPGMESQC